MQTVVGSSFRGFNPQDNPYAGRPLGQTGKESFLCLVEALRRQLLSTFPDFLHRIENIAPKASDENSNLVVVGEFKKGEIDSHKRGCRRKCASDRRRSSHFNCNSSSSGLEGEIHYCFSKLSQGSKRRRAARWHRVCVILTALRVGDSEFDRFKMSPGLLWRYC